MASIAAKATTECLRNVFAHLELLEKLVSDNGPTFVSAEFKTFFKGMVSNTSRHLPRM